MVTMRSLVSLAVLGAILLLGGPVRGDQTDLYGVIAPVSVVFERDGDKTLRADAVIRAPSETVWSLIRKVEHYPSLVSWIEESRAAAGSRDPDHEVYMALRLPWPVGRIWNVVQLQDVGYHAIRWNMVSGSIKENSGYVRVESVGNAARVIYESRVDIGYPTWLTDPVERAMIRQFMTRLQMQACPVLAQNTGGTAGSKSC